MLKKNVVKLALVRDEARRQQGKLIRRCLFDAARLTAESREDELSGFVLMAWDKEGNIRTSVLEGQPFPRAQLPYLFRDAVQQQQAAEIAATAGAMLTFGGDDESA